MPKYMQFRLYWINKMTSFALSFFRHSLAALTALGFAAGSAIAAGNAKHPHALDWSWQGPMGSYDRASIQRGYQVYDQVCAACHGMKFMSYRNLGQKGGPYYDKAYPNPNDNPYVKTIASEKSVTDGPDDEGDMFERPGKPSDYFVSPFANDQAARASNGGALPPDLSLMTRARHGGADYVYAILAGYKDAPEGLDVPAGQYYNPYFPGDVSGNWSGDPREVPYGGFLAMAPPLIEGIVTYACKPHYKGLGHGDDKHASLLVTGLNPAYAAGGSDHVELQDCSEYDPTVEEMAYDVVNFLQWAADPKMEIRKQTGMASVIYLLFMTLLLYLSYRAIWSKVEH